jgi:uncharacterized membrane protein
MAASKSVLAPNQPLHSHIVKSRREKIKSIKSKMDVGRNWSDRLADQLTGSFGTMWFLSFNALWFVLWMILNTGLIPGIIAFDPFPYGLLTMVVSLEAIFLSIIVLMSQNRASHVADLREEIDLHVNVRAEEEITRILIILDQIHDHLGLPSEDDEELVLMKQKTNIDAIEDELLKDMK